MVKLHLLDVYHNLIKDEVDIIATSIQSSHKVKVKAIGSNIIGLPELRQNEIYRLFIDPPSYLCRSQFINSNADTKRLYFTIDPRKVIKIEFSNQLEFPRMPFDFNYYSPLQQAGLTNIIAKARHTVLPSGRSVSDYLFSTEIIQADRIWCEYSIGLLEEVDGNPDFEQVPDALHSFEGEAPDVSFKTNDNYGNLQLTFYASDTDKPVVELDIDDASGLAHIFQVAKHELTGRKTHPYDIHQILLAYQGIDPGYKLII